MVIVKVLIEVCKVIIVLAVTWSSPGGSSSPCLSVVIAFKSGVTVTAPKPHENAGILSDEKDLALGVDNHFDLQ